MMEDIGFAILQAIILMVGIGVLSAQIKLYTESVKYKVLDPKQK